jgi:hypothetical protein
MKLYGIFCSEFWSGVDYFLLKIVRCEHHSIWTVSLQFLLKSILESLQDRLYYSKTSSPVRFIQQFLKEVFIDLICIKLHTSGELI